MAQIRHTVIFTWYDTTTSAQKAEVTKLLNEMGEWLADNLGVTGWVVAEHITDTYKAGRAHLLQDCIFPNTKALEAHSKSEVHKKVIELTPRVCDWMTIDTTVEDTVQ